MIGETERLPKQTFDALTKAEELTKNNTGLILNLPSTMVDVLKSHRLLS